jgi:gliding motility-associated-like protein
MSAITRVYEISDICGNTKTASQDIMIRDYILPYIFCPADRLICAADSEGTLVYNIAPEDYYDNCTSVDDLVLTYTISGATNISGTGDASGTFFNNGSSIVTYSVTDLSDNTISESFTVTINPQPVSSEIIGIGSPLCEASSQSYSITADPASEFLWTVPSDAKIVTDTSGQGVTAIEVNFGYNGGYVTVTETDKSSGCQGETKYLEIGLIGCPLIADFTVDKSSLCPLDSVTVVSTSSGISLGTQYHWDFGENAYPQDASGPGPHTVRYNSSGSKSIQLRVEDGSVETSTKNIQVGGLPEEFLGSDQEICEGASYTFTPVESCVEYLWHDGSTSDSYEARNSGIISVAVIDELGCTGYDSVQLTVHPNPLVELGDDHELCNPEGENISAGDFALYNWSTGDISSSITVFPDAGMISVTVTDWYDCSASDQVTILTCSEVTSVLEVPEIISPNGDGIQDTWNIERIELYPDARIQVFDLYGRKVFQADHDYTNSWNGTYNGITLPVGRYFYIIDFQSADMQPITGSVCIIH